MPDLHAEFRDPQSTESSLLEEFLDEVDRIPGMRNLHAAMRTALGLRPGMRVLDAGCGTGLEITRLAKEHPDVTFTGLDQNEQLLAAARRRATLPNVEWVHTALEAAELPERHFDAIRTERVLMYSPDPAFGWLLDLLVRLLRPGGRLVLFELDYGAVILPVDGHDDMAVRTLTGLLERAMPQPWAGRKIPAELAARSMSDVTAEPYAMAANEQVWRPIVHDTLREALRRDPSAPPELHAWLDDHAARLSDVPLSAVFTGILTTARTTLTTEFALDTIGSAR